MNIIIKEDYEELSQLAAEFINETIREKESPVLGLATGSTPIRTYEILVDMYRENSISFENVTTINLDEYIGLSPKHEQSYRYFMDDILFSKVDINIDNTYIPNGLAQDTKKESQRYDKLIDELGGVDLQILGIGTNAHIGFNEPGARLNLATHETELTKDTIEANSRFFEDINDVPTRAITMGIGSIFKAKKIILLASGESKAKAIKALSNTYVNTMIPATLLKLHPDVTIIVDREAASLLD